MTENEAAFDVHVRERLLQSVSRVFDPVDAEQSKDVLVSAVNRKRCNGSVHLTVGLPD
jgi:hypothetical protein